MSATQCSICLGTTHPTKCLSSVDENDMLCDKLRYIAPETDWLEEYRICNCCIDQLYSACKFKAQCLAVGDRISTVKTEFKTLNEIHDGCDLLDNDCDTLSIEDEKCIDKHCETTKEEEYFACYNCGKKCKSKTDLIEHLHSHNAPESTLGDRNTEHNGKYKAKEYKCLKCGRGYVLEASLNQHLIKCDGIRRHVKSDEEYQCKNCKKFYTSEKILKVHEKRCKHTYKNRRTGVQCKNCNNYYISTKTLKDHYKRGCKKDNSVQVLFCRICDEYFKTSNALKEHNLAEHNISDYHCLKCAINFDTIEEYISHKKTKHPLEKTKRAEARLICTKFNCEICGEEFRLLREIVKHCFEEHSMEEKTIRPYSCDKCDNRFRTSTNLINHRLYHDRNRVHICSFCGKAFITKNDLTAHEHLHYSTRNYKCDKCEKAFKTNTNLRTHQLIVHTDPSLWKYTCYVCNKRFAQKSNHDQHVRRHTGEKNFVCPLCRKSFVSKNEMQEHVDYHSNIKSHRCRLCGKKYKKKHTYDVHLTKVHGVGNAKIPVKEKKHACHICPSRFYERSKLTRHLCTHSGLKPFHCYACEKKFTDKSYLNRHLKFVHNIVESTTKIAWID